MASIHPKGATFLLLLLSLAFAFASAGDVDLRALIDRQEEQLNKLRGLVDSLTDSVYRLESVLSDGHPFQSGYVPDPSSGGEKKGIVVKKSKPLWLERFQLIAEARLVVEASCATVLPYVDDEVVTKYFALGDVRGRVILFSSAGDELIESNSPSGSPVTSMLAYMPVRKNESFLFTGHADGSVVARKIWETSVGSGGWIGPAVGTPCVFFQGGEGGELGKVELLEVHQIGRVRYVVSAYGDGSIRVFTENGTLYGVTSVSSKLLAFMKQRSFFLTEKGAGWLDLRRMTVLESDCEGLNGSLVKSYAFDVPERSKAYGFTQEGNLVRVVLLGDGASIKCRVRAMKKSEVGGHVSLLAIKGYLLAVNHERVFLYNVSSQHFSRFGVSRPAFVTTLAELKSLFPSSDDLEDGLTDKKPVIAGDRGKLVVLGLGGRYIGVYRPNFPVVKVQSNIVLWGSPALLFFMFLLGMWYLYANKRGSMTWTPEESFVGSASAAAAGLLGTTGSKRPFADAQTSDVRDVRGHVRRGPARRYTSPSRYSGGGTRIPYRQSPADTGFAGGAGLKYRGSQAVEPGVFPLRREPIFSNNQALDDHID